MSTTTVERLEPRHVDALGRFFAGLPDGDLTFVKEDVGDRATLEAWAQPGRASLREVALDQAGEVIGFLALLPLVGWSSHVGELRLVVQPAQRSRGLGSTLARRALLAAAGLGLTKVVVEVVAAQEGAVRLFTGLGWQGEALLRDHIRDRTGELRDLLLLAYFVEDSWSAMAVTGVQDAITGTAAPAR